MRSRIGPEKLERHQRTRGGADEAETERPLFNLHHPLEVGQSRRQAAHAE